jgi:hypothetical protein
MITSDSVINSLGGTKALSSALSLAPSTVSVWRVRGIPAEHWLALVRLASKQGVSGITLEALAMLGSKKEARA